MKQTRQLVRAVKQSIYLDVYASGKPILSYEEVNARGRNTNTFYVFA
jgi:hypothetical protein